MSPDESLQLEPALAQARERLEKPVLDYPFAAPPLPGQTVEIVPGVLWMRMPMGGKLDHVNAWAVRDGSPAAPHGWAVVDSGLHSADTVFAWHELFSSFASRSDAAIDMPGRLTRVLITHMHPDHIGMAGWLVEKFNCRLWMTQLEYLQCRVLAADTGCTAPQDALQFYRRAGWGHAAIEGYKKRFGNFGRHIYALPQSYRRIVDGESIRIGQNEWRVVVGTGHSPEHACYYCPALKLLISGDQVLPRISSNVSVHPAEPDANPMQQWLSSIEKIKREVPDDVLVLPSHHDPFRGLHARLDYLAASQLRTLARLKKTLRTPKRAIDVFVALFGRAIEEADGGLMHLATGESIACLNYLLHLGEATRTLDDGGVAWYEAGT
jgi:glyoxylase-like metal-dependent hydrolase (beta-lactamase superfamily II)